MRASSDWTELTMIEYCPCGDCKHSEPEALEPGHDGGPYIDANVPVYTRRPDGSMKYPGDLPDDWEYFPPDAVEWEETEEDWWHLDESANLPAPPEVQIVIPEQKRLSNPFRCSACDYD